MNPLQELQDAYDQGLQPRDRAVWLQVGTGEFPHKFNAIAINPDCLPTDAQCRVVAGLDVFVQIKGYDNTGFGKLRRLCHALYRAGPRRLQVHDLDYGKAAYLKLGGHHA